MRSTESVLFGLACWVWLYSWLSWSGICVGLACAGVLGQVCWIGCVGQVCCSGLKFSIQKVSEKQILIKSLDKQSTLLDID